MTTPVKSSTRVCICGGGNLGHALAAVLGANEQVELRLLTRRPEHWAREIHLLYRNDIELIGRIDLVTNDPAAAVAEADLVLVALPVFAYREVLTRIGPFVPATAWVGACPGLGFDWVARDILGPKAKIFGLQREPYVCRVISYGETVKVAGIRPELLLAALPTGQGGKIAEEISNLLGITVKPLTNYLSVTLVPANSIMHPARLYTLYNSERGLPQQQVSYFYADWNDEASRIFLQTADELLAVCEALPLDMSGVKAPREHFGVSGSGELTSHIRRIEALRDIPTPMVRTPQGFLPDLNHRFFQEDIPFGLVVLRSIAEYVSVRTPTIDKLIEWGQTLLQRTYLTEGAIRGPHTTDLPIPQNYGLVSVDDLVAHAAL